MFLGQDNSFCSINTLVVGLLTGQLLQMSLSVPINSKVVSPLRSPGNDPRQMGKPRILTLMANQPELMAGERETGQLDNLHFDVTTVGKFLQITRPTWPADSSWHLAPRAPT